MDKQITFTSAPIVIPPAALPSREIGACVEFQGIVRELEQGRALSIYAEDGAQVPPGMGTGRWQVG